MKFSANWLREFVDLPSSDAELADLLTMAGIEIEGITSRGADFAKVIVAQITESKQHPNADRLSVCTVNDGSATPRQIVCGATNYHVADKVPLALPGAELPGGLKIRESKLRGVESAGMLCSAKELALADDAAGLLILAPDAEVGAPIGRLFPADTIFDVEITPNRGDLLSHFGLAREIAALTHQALKLQLTLPEPPQPSSEVKISAAAECPFYSLRRIENVKVGPSPSWLRSRLESVGLRSINNVVDVSNFVMLELGQPTHAFDAAKVDGAVQVRLARKGEELLALDGKTYTLTAETLVIADDTRVLGLAGVMGGEESGVAAETTTILLESAYFSPASIRHTSRQLRLPSDASYRFERGVDPAMVLPASSRVAELLRTFAEAVPAAELGQSGQLPAPPPDVTLRYQRTDQLLGAPIDPGLSDEILTRFGLEPAGAPGLVNTIWKIPSHRRDLKREVDLIEEIGRGWGLDHIPAADRSRFTPLSAADKFYDWQMKVRRSLATAGFSEARTSSLASRAILVRAGDDVMILKNPLSEDHVALRTSLLPGLLSAAAHNLRSGAPRVALFEIGDIFTAPEGTQRRMLGLVLWGRREPEWRTGPGRSFDFYDLKGVVDTIADFDWVRAEKQGLVLGAELLFDSEHAGFVGQLSRAETAAAGLEGNIYVAEFGLRRIAATEQDSISFREIDRFPAIKRDIAMFVAPEVMHGDVTQVIALANEPLLESAKLFDLFSENTGREDTTARKSLGYSLTYRAKNRTLTTEEVSAAHSRIRERLREEVRAELRE
ncbi:MAG: phenylalanine--tRNA ligase subunit beta [Verrucomicrobiota bacterium]